jgi:FkbM family methyltransferase
MADETKRAVQLDPEGFNELRMCRTGPLLYNRFDTYVGGSLKKYAEFSEREQELFRQLVLPGALVVEAGANIGAHTVVFSKLVGPSGQVHAFEPVRLVFQALCANLALNQCTNVFAHQCAASSAPGTLYVPPLAIDRRGNFGGTSLLDKSDGDPVAAVAIDSLDLPACNFLKADVEGMEIDVIRGAQRTIEMYRPLLYIENDRQASSQSLLELIFSLDYRIYWHLASLFNPDNFAGDNEDIFPGIVSVNVFCIPSESKLAVEGMPRVESPSETWKSRPKPVADHWTGNDAR